MKIKIEDYVFGGEQEVDLEESAGVRVGQKVRHRNEGVHAGSAGPIKVGVGEVLNVEYQGFGFLGHTFTAKVKWSNGETFTLNTILLQDESEDKGRLDPNGLIIMR